MFCTVDVSNLEVGVRTLRPAAATWTEEAKEVTMTDTNPTRLPAPCGVRGSSRLQLPTKTNENLRLFKG